MTTKTTPGANDPGDLLVQFKSDLQVLALSRPYAEVGGVVIVGLLQVAEVLFRRAIRHDPTSLAPVLAVIDDLRAAALKAAEPPAAAPVESWN